MLNKLLIFIAIIFIMLYIIYYNNFVSHKYKNSYYLPIDLLSLVGIIILSLFILTYKWTDIRDPMIDPFEYGYIFSRTFNVPDWRQSTLLDTLKYRVKNNILMHALEEVLTKLKESNYELNRVKINYEDIFNLNLDNKSRRELANEIYNLIINKPPRFRFMLYNAIFDDVLDLYYENLYKYKTGIVKAERRLHTKILTDMTLGVGGISETESSDEKKEYEESSDEKKEYEESSDEKKEYEESSDERMSLLG